MDGDLGRPLEVVDAAPVAAVEPAGADPLEGLGPQAVQAEVVDDGQGGPAGLDRLGALTADDQRPGQLDEDEGVRAGGWPPGQEGRRLAQVSHAELAVPLAAQEPAEQGPGLGRPLEVAGGQQRLGGVGQQLLAGVLGVHAGLAEPEQQGRAGRVAGGGQLQGAGVEAGRGPEGVEGGGAVAGVPQGLAGPVGQVGVVLAGRPGEGERP